MHSDNMKTDISRKLRIIICQIDFIKQDQDMFEMFLAMLTSDKFLLSEYLKNHYLQHHFFLLDLQRLFASNWFSFTKYYQFHMPLLSHTAIK